MINDLNSYFSGALYYPRISFTDPYLIKSLSFLHDKVYRIVPEGVTPEDDQSLQPLIEAGYVGAMIDPMPYSKNASNVFLKKINTWNAAALSPCDDDVDLAQIHNDKTDVKLRDLFHDLGYSDNGDWHQVPVEIASNYMLFLATEIAKKNRLGLITDEIAPWTAVNYFNVDGKVDDYASCGLDENVSATKQFGLFNLIINNLLPINIADIPSQSIVKFREKRQDEVRNLRDTISSLYDEILGVNEGDIKIDIIKTKAQRLESARVDYIKSAESFKADKWFGATTWSFPAMGLLCTALGIEPMSTAILSATCAAVGMIVNLNVTKRETKSILSKSSASGFIAFQEDFGHYRRNRNIDNISGYSWNSMEEYIND